MSKCSLSKPLLDSPVQLGEIAPIEDLQANAVYHFRIFFSGSELVIRHQTEEDRDEIFDAHQVQALTECFRVEEVEKAAEEWLIERHSFSNWTL
jgi:hypothetical protein